MQLITKKIFWISLVFILFLYSWDLRRNNPKPIINVSEQNRQLNFNKNALKALSLGQERLISSILWIQTLMESDLEHYKNNDLNSWMFLRFDTITELDPNFYEAYLWGGIYLSIVKDDAIGAKSIYKKGLEVFPKDLELNFNSGFNNFFELNDVQPALENFKVIVDDPAGQKRWPKIFGLYNKLKYSKGVPYKEIFDVIETKYLTEKDKRLKSYYYKQLFDIRTTEDLKCLNTEQDQISNCRKENLFGETYLIDKNGKFISPREFRPYFPGRIEN
jgi:hypothetical protein